MGRIWREVGWIDSTEQAKALEYFLQDATGYVAEIRGAPEVSVTAHAGLTRYIDRDLPMWGITSVTVSRIARKQGFAGTLTARLLAEGAERGSAIAMLGMFDQGYYDRLGFGTGSYERYLSFDPASLLVEGAPRPPRRVENGHFGPLHAGVVAGQKRHGSSWFPEANALRAEMEWTKNAFGLGYFTEDESMLTHFLWGEAKDENGPYEVYFYSYRNDEEFLELLRVIKSLGDQVHGIRMKEPPGIMLQDFLEKPFKQRRQTRDGVFASRHSAQAYWQLRILDMEAAIAACTGTTELDFTASIRDPVTPYLTDRKGWQGAGGTWEIHLGETSRARRLHAEPAAGPSIVTDIGSLSRLWFGAASARSLALQGRLQADPETVAALDSYFRLPEPHPWWDF